MLYRISFPNGKAYIGITVNSLARRFAEHVYTAKRGSRLPVHAALRKYGAEAVSVDTLVVADDRDYLQEIERRAIAVCGTRSPDGYNATDGGDGAPLGNSYRKGKPFSAEVRARMSEVRKGRSVHTAESRARIGAAAKGNKYAAGLIHGTETIHKRRLTLLTGAPRPQGKSGVKGVSWCKQTGRWRAHITLHGKTICLGRHDEMQAAIAARQAAETRYLTTGAGVS